MACGLYAVTQGIKVLFKEIYQKMRTVKDYIAATKALLERYHIPQLANDWVDHLTEHRNQWMDAGFNATLAEKDVLAGIEAIRNELANATLLFNEHSLDFKDESLKNAPKRLTEEIAEYAMKTKEQQIRSAKPDHPAERQIDHACDHLRYFVLGVATPLPTIPDLDGAVYYQPQETSYLY